MNGRRSRVSLTGGKGKDIPGRKKGVNFFSNLKIFSCFLIIYIFLFFIFTFYLKASRRGKERG